jgi:hypothetical protein
VLALSGNVDPYGSRQYHRYEPLVAKVVQTIHDECNFPPSARRQSRQASKKDKPQKRTTLNNDEPALQRDA